MRYDNGASHVRNWISTGGANNVRCPGIYGTPPTDSTPGDHTSYTSIYSLADELVNPDIAIINGAKNISVENASHFTLTKDAEVFAHVLNALQGAGLNDGVAVSVPKRPSFPPGITILLSTDPKP